MAKLIINGQPIQVCVNHDPECCDIIKFTHTVYTYSEYLKSYDWLRHERKYPFIISCANYDKNGIGNNSFTFTFLCKVEYEAFCYRPIWVA